MNYAKRLERLEQIANPQGPRIVWVNIGETQEHAAARTGADPATAMFIRWQSPDDMRL